MSFACQRDGYLRQLSSEVVSCSPAKLKLSRHGQKETISGHEVVCQDSVLFPEGGGQNSDHGTLNGLPVLQVSRKGGQAIHFVVDSSGFTVGEIVQQEVDWTRRFDNMQQHSGQHLISALFESQLAINTTSWWMAENNGDKVGVSYIELDQPSITKEQVQQIEDQCNQAIRDHLEVSVHMFEDAHDPALTAAHTRGLPDDLAGPVRVVNIGSLDSNMCCGTHVKNLSELQAIKLLSVDKGKKEKSLLNFLVGNRVLKYLDNGFRREQALTQILKGGIDDHIGLVGKYVKNVKIAQKSLQNVLKELAVVEANVINQQNDRKFVLVHKKDGDSDYMNTFLHEMINKDLFVCIAVGDESQGPCQLAIVGQEKIVQDLGPRLISILDGKGGGKGNRINGRIPSLKSWSNVVKEVEAYFSD